jgi:hypothetical protein
MVPDRAVSLLKWRITHNPSAPLPNSASKYNQCGVKGQDKFSSQAKIFAEAAWNSSPLLSAPEGFPRRPGRLFEFRLAFHDGLRLAHPACLVLPACVRTATN